MSAVDTADRSGTRAGARPVRVIEPLAPGPRERLAEWWTYRRTLRFFGRRLIQKSYLRTVLGWVWIPLRPIMDVGTKILVFGFLLKAPSDGIPYAIFFLIGQSCWLFFSSTLYWMTRSIELNRRFIRHMYIPRLTLLTSALAPSSMNLGIYGILTLLVALFYLVQDGTMYIAFGPGLLLAVAGLLLMIAIAASIGFFTAVYGAMARDVRFALSYALGFWFFLTPVIYPLSAIPENVRWLASLNPMTAPMEMVKVGLLGETEATASAFIMCGLFILIVGGFGLRFFSRAESKALDRL
jgi:lipopolysaccharide transport system permease protein